MSWLTVLLCASLALGAKAQNATSNCSSQTGSVYDYSILHNNETDTIHFADYAGFTGQLLKINALLDDYNGQLAVVAIPCNQFNLHEQGTNEQIANCYRYVNPGNNFIPSFDLAAKLPVNGKNQHELYTYLKASCPSPIEFLAFRKFIFYSPIRVNDVTWNYEKFLIDTNGQPYKRYEPLTDPDYLRPDIDAILKTAKIEKTAPKEVKRSSKNGSVNISPSSGY